MKYAYKPERYAPQEQQRVNEALVHLVRTDALARHGVSLQEVYNGFTGRGGLHGLTFDEFASFHEYSAAKREYEKGEFFTPHPLARAVVEALEVGASEAVLDPTCGAGVFFNFLSDEANAWGVEVDAGNAAIAQALYPEARIERADIRGWEPSRFFDVVVCNPPYALDFGGVASQEVVVDVISKALRPAGLCALIVPASYGRDDYATREQRALNASFSFLGEWGIPRDTFKVGIDLKVMLLARRSEHLPHVLYDSATACAVVPVEQLRDRMAGAVHEHRRQACAKRALLRREEMGCEVDDDFASRAAKLVYDISTLKDPARDERARALLHEFATQSQPEGMPYERWVQVRLTPARVLARLRQLRQPNPPQEHRVALVRRPGGLQWKGYSHRTRTGLDRTVYRFSNPDAPTDGYERLVRRKRAQAELLATPYEQVPDALLAEPLAFIDALPLRRSSTGEQIVLTDVQRLDTARMMTKPSGYLQWDTGAGKTISAMIQAAYRAPRVRNTFVVSTALAINNNLAGEFEDFGFRVRVLKSLADVRRIEDGEVVMVTFGMLITLQRHIKRHIKVRAHKVALILDEADGIATVTSARSKATLNCFRRAKYKLLMSATSTRNNVSESFTAFELMYNNSDAFLDRCPSVYEERRTPDGVRIVEIPNPHMGQPFGAYSRGLRQFKKAFSPSKATVFGVHKYGQTVYNAEQLRQFVRGSMITRTFEEVTGRDLVKIKQLHVTSSAAEEALYADLIERFENYRRLYASTGVTRKDAMLRIIQQLNALLTAPAYPQRFDPSVVPSKAAALERYVRERPDEYVAVGLTHVQAAAYYASVLTAAFPDRPVFFVTGADTSLKGRRRVIADLRASGNGILVCTQQAFASSVNIDFVDHIVLLELQWNFAAMKQFFTRFARFTSRNAKTVTFLLNRSTIETNLTRLLIEKEQMNLFMRGLDDDFDDIAQGLGLDDDFFAALLDVEHDVATGRRHIAWHAQGAPVAS